MSIFSNLGSDHAEQEMERAMNEPVKLTFEIKPFTTKAESHIIDALDAFSTEMGTSRNTLVVNLLTEYLPIAIHDYFRGRYEFLQHAASLNVTEEQYIFDCLSAMLKRSDLTETASEFLTSSIVDHVMGPGTYEAGQNAK